MIDDRFLPRVWTDKGYYYPIFSELGITYENKNLPFTEENIKDINWAFRWWFNHSKENVDMEYINTLEQCTGLKDKNCKLIYEGDIVKIIDKSSRKEPFIGVVEYTNTASFEANCNGFYMHLHNPKTPENVSMIEKMFCSSLREIEIIGNIHENTDLLEEQE